MAETSIKYTELKERLISMFSKEKLEAAPGEWGFFNEIREEISCIGFATNISPEIIDEANQMGVDLLLTHHDSWDFIFGLKEACNCLLTDYGITHAFFHAPLDDAEFGTSASLAKALGIEIDQVDMPYLDLFHCGVIGNIPETSFDTFLDDLSDVLQEPIRYYQNNYNPINRIAVTTGGGNMTPELQCAIEHGCDTYVTGEYTLYSQQYAKLHNLNLFVGSHTNTEILGVESMVRRLCEGLGIRRVCILEPNY